MAPPTIMFFGLFFLPERYVIRNEHVKFTQTTNVVVHAGWFIEDVSMMPWLSWHTCVLTTVPALTETFRWSLLVSCRMSPLTRFIRQRRTLLCLKRALKTIANEHCSVLEYTCSRNWLESMSFCKLAKIYIKLIYVSHTTSFSLGSIFHTFCNPPDSQRSTRNCSATASVVLWIC